MSQTDDTPPADQPAGPSTDGTSTGTLQSKSGWDGKLRLNKDKRAVLANPEALLDSDYSDEDAPPVDEIQADEGMCLVCYVLNLANSQTDLLDAEDPDVEEIDVQHSRVSSIPALRLERFKKIVRLCLRQNSIHSIELPEEIASTLQELELYDNLISHVKGLESFTELRSLDFSYNKIKHIKRVDHLKKLEYIYFVQNKISRIEGLEGMTNLKYLELGANRIRVCESETADEIVD